MEILNAWEQWTGTAKDFYKSVGVSKPGFAAIIGKAKRMRREGHFPAEEFKEIKVTDLPSEKSQSYNHSFGAELVWENGKIIRFCQVDQLIDFLKKVA
jgi:hypothetical protein